MNHLELPSTPCARWYPFTCHMARTGGSTRPHMESLSCLYLSPFKKVQKLLEKKNKPLLKIGSVAFFLMSTCCDKNKKSQQPTPNCHQVPSQTSWPKKQKKTPIKNPKSPPLLKSPPPPPLLKVSCATCTKKLGLLIRLVDPLDHSMESNHGL